MKINKMFFAGLSLALTMGAIASDAKPFTCSTTLEYKINNETKTIPLNIYGERSSTNTLNGKGVIFEVGTKVFKLQLPSVMLSDSVVSLKGTITKDQTSLDFLYLENSDGSQNLSNRASVSIRTSSGRVITASKNSDIVCDIGR
jgi:hypothetical protein